MRRAAAWLLALALALGLCACAPEAVPALPSPSPAPAAPALAFFASSDDAWSRAVLDELAAWCAEEGWSLVDYDCAGHAATQALQIADLAREQEGGVAVICPVGGAEEVEAWAQTLKARRIVPITLSRRAGAGCESVACHIAPEPGGILAAAAGHLKGTQTVILHDAEAAPLEAAAPEALSRAGVTVAGRSFTWGSADYAKASLTAALQAAPRAGAVLCFSRAGTQTALDTLRASGRDGQVKVVCLDCAEEAADVLDWDGADALAAVSPSAAAGALKEVIPLARRGKAPRTVELTVTITRAEEKG